MSNALAYDEVRLLRDQANAENLELRAQLGQSPWFEGIVGDSAEMRRVLERVEQVGTTDATVLITGETGTGKELVARAIHQRSPRTREPFIKVNCAAIPETLLASELFGHERGAFTGAIERRRGRFELADRGTCSSTRLASVSDTQAPCCARCRNGVRAAGRLAHREWTCGSSPRRINLAADVAAGRFRSDLHYRLNVFPVRAGAQGHPDDIAPLVAHFAAKFARFGA